MKRYILTITGILFLNFCYAQQKPAGSKAIKPLKIGDVFPKVILTNVKNYSSGTLDLSQQNGKLIIIDFWGAYCKGCLRAFEKIDTLQKKYRGEVFFVMPTKSTQEQVEGVLKKLKGKVKLPEGVPYVTSDKILSSYFYYYSVPHMVWINKVGRVEQISSGMTIDDKTIAAALAGKKLKLFEKTDRPYFTKIDLPDNGSDSRVVYFTSLMKKLKELRSYDCYSITDSLTGKLIGLHAHAYSVIDLFKIVVARDIFMISSLEFPFLNNNRVIAEVAHPELYIPPTDMTQWEAWYENNSYRFTFKIPHERSDELYDLLDQELQKLFGLEAGIEKREVNCLVLKRTDSIDHLQTKTAKGVTAYKASQDFDLNYYLENVPFSNFMRMLVFYNRKLSLPIIDDTGYKGNIDIALDTKLDNIAKLRTELRKYGLALVEEKKEVDMLVLKQKAKGL